MRQSGLNPVDQRHHGQQVGNTSQPQNCLVGMNRPYQMRSVFARACCRCLALDVPVASKLFDPPVIEWGDIAGDDVSILEFPLCLKRVSKPLLHKKLPAF